MTNEEKLHKLVKEAYEEGMADAPPFAGAAGCGAWETSYAKDELAKLSNTAPATPDDIGAFWLVERRVEAPLDDHHPGTLLFLTGWPGKFSWTEDWQLATRFKTEAEAEDFITCDDGSTINGLEAVQHGFISQQPETPDDVLEMAQQFADKHYQRGITNRAVRDIVAEAITAERARFDKLVEAVEALPVEEMIHQEPDGSPTLLGYCMQAQGEWDAVQQALSDIKQGSASPTPRGEVE